MVYSTEIVLSPEDMEFAERVALTLHNQARILGVSDAHGARPGEITREDEIGGAQAELAAAKLLGVKWSAGEQEAPRNGPDIGHRTQVRHVWKAFSKSLIIRPWDIQKYGDVPFVLMRKQGPKFIAKGWIMGSEAMSICPLTDKGTGRPPAWFVSENQLHPIQELRDV